MRLAILSFTALVLNAVVLTSGGGGYGGGGQGGMRNGGGRHGGGGRRSGGGHGGGGRGGRRNGGGGYGGRSHGGRALGSSGYGRENFGMNQEEGKHSWQSTIAGGNSMNSIGDMQWQSRRGFSRGQGGRRQATGACADKPCKWFQKCQNTAEGTEGYECAPKKKICGVRASPVMSMAGEPKNCSSCNGTKQFCMPAHKHQVCCQDHESAVTMTFDAAKSDRKCKRGQKLSEFLGNTINLKYRFALKATSDMTDPHAMAVFVEPRLEVLSANLGDQHVEELFRCRRPGPRSCLIGVIDLRQGCNAMESCPVDLGQLTLDPKEGCKLPTGNVSLIFNADALDVAKAANCSVHVVDIEIEDSSESEQDVDKDGLHEGQCRVIPDTGLMGYGAYILQGPRLIHYDPVARMSPVYRPVHHPREFGMVRRMAILRRLLAQRLNANTEFDCAKYDEKVTDVPSVDVEDDEDLMMAQIEKTLRESSPTDVATRTSNITSYMLAAKECNRDEYFHRITRNMGCPYQKAIGRMIGGQFRSEIRSSQPSTVTPNPTSSVPDPDKKDSCINGLMRDFLAKHSLRDNRLHFDGPLDEENVENHLPPVARGKRDIGARASIKAFPEMIEDVSAHFQGHNSKLMGDVREQMEGRCGHKPMDRLMSTMGVGVEHSCEAELPQFHWQVHDGAVYQGLQIQDNKWVWMKRAVCKCNGCRAVPPRRPPGPDMSKPLPFGPPKLPTAEFGELQSKLIRMGNLIEKPAEIHTKHDENTRQLLRDARAKLDANDFEGFKSIMEQLQKETKDFEKLIEDLNLPFVTEFKGGPAFGLDVFREIMNSMGINVESKQGSTNGETELIVKTNGTTQAEKEAMSKLLNAFEQLKINYGDEQKKRQVREQLDQSIRNCDRDEQNWKQRLSFVREDLTGVKDEVINEYAKTCIANGTCMPNHFGGSWKEIDITGIFQVPDQLEIDEMNEEIEETDDLFSQFTGGGWEDFDFDFMGEFLGGNSGSESGSYEHAEGNYGGIHQGGHRGYGSRSGGRHGWNYQAQRSRGMTGGSGGGGYDGSWENSGSASHEGGSRGQAHGGGSGRMNYGGGSHGNMNDENGQRVSASHEGRQGGHPGQDHGSHEDGHEGEQAPMQGPRSGPPNGPQNGRGQSGPSGRGHGQGEQHGHGRGQVMSGTLGRQEGPRPEPEGHHEGGRKHGGHFNQIQQALKPAGSGIMGKIRGLFGG